MPGDLAAHDSARYRPAALVALGLAGGMAGLTALAAPAYWRLAAYGLYAIPAHLLISFLAHEPALWYAARLYPAPLVALVGTASTVVAILMDYWLIGWLVNHHLVRPVVQESRWFQFAKRWFGKAPALLIAGSALAPVPFYPVKILAIASGYPLGRFIVALIVGRLPRFYALARIGGQVEAPRISVLALVVFGLAAVSVWRIWKTRRDRMPSTLANGDLSEKSVSPP